MQSINEILAQELGQKLEYVENVVTLMDEGNTIPFIARYRKEMHGAMDDTTLRNLETRLTYLRNLQQRREEEPSSAVKQRVDAARKIQNKRFGENGMYNGRMGPEQMRAFCQLDEGCAKLMRMAYDHYGLTARSYDRIVRVARTIADLAGAENIGYEHLYEALQFRMVGMGENELRG